MTTARFSHSQCPHPSTKAARAKCRAALRAAAEPVAAAALKAATEKPVAAVTPAVAVAREETCTKCSEAYVTTVPEAADVDPLCDDCTAPAGIEITPETWREHKDKPASVYLVGVEEPVAAQQLTGWSIKFLQFTDAEGKRQRIESSTVERVTV
ncbi:hypothetical protein ACFWIB_16965 [Streptomyces sp. NPDC127051]|uniref:hypothetical protein n=1 Tax=Streptomyces sp. NPDC127051 TaxID=3347119 RepID=UPI003650B62C